MGAAAHVSRLQDSRCFKSPHWDSLRSGGRKAVRAGMVRAEDRETGSAAPNNPGTKAPVAGGRRDSERGAMVVGETTPGGISEPKEQTEI